MPAEHSTRRRVIYFDILRIVAIFFVVFVHLAAQHWADVDVSSRAWFAFNLYCTTGKWSVPIFVMISGALFLGRDVSISSILKKNVARIATVFLFWSGCYALIDLVFRHAPLSVVLSQFITGHYHLWFLYMIVGLYLLIPLLRPIASERNAYALLPAAGAYLYVSSPSACPVFLLYLAAAERCDQNRQHVYLLLFSARLHGIFCRRILFKPQGLQPQRGGRPLRCRHSGASFLHNRPRCPRQGAGRAERCLL